MPFTPIPYEALKSIPYFSSTTEAISSLNNEKSSVDPTSRDNISWWHEGAHPDSVGAQFTMEDPLKDEISPIHSLCPPPPETLSDLSLDRFRDDAAFSFKFLGGTTRVSRLSPNEHGTVWTSQLHDSLDEVISEAASADAEANSAPDSSVSGTESSPDQSSESESGLETVAEQILWRTPKRAVPTRSRKRAAPSITPTTQRPTKKAKKDFIERVCRVEGCKHVSASPTVCHRHRDTHFPPRFRCPIKDCTHEPSIFKRESAAVRHVQAYHNKNYKCPQRDALALRQAFWLDNGFQLDSYPQ